MRLHVQSFLLTQGRTHFQGDVQLMSDTGLEAYRFSISWSRLLPSKTTILGTSTTFQFHGKFVLTSK